MPLIRSSSSAKPSAENEAATAGELLAELRSGDVESRRAALRAAFRAGRADLLAQHLAHEDDAGLRESILVLLVRIGGPEAARPLIETLRGADALLRNAVIETLQSMGEPIAPEIESLLDDENPDLRIYGVNILQSLRSPRAPEIALRVAANDPHVNVCAAAVDILAELGKPEMIPQLRAVAARFPEYAFLAFAVRAAIDRIG